MEPKKKKKENVENPDGVRNGTSYQMPYIKFNPKQNVDKIQWVTAMDY